MNTTEQYTSDLGKVLKTKDVSKLRAFLIKNNMPTLNDEKLEIVMHKMICNRVDMPERLKKESKEWLNDRNYRETINWADRK